MVAAEFENGFIVCMIKPIRKLGSAGLILVTSIRLDRRQTFLYQRHPD